MRILSDAMRTRAGTLCRRRPPNPCYVASLLMDQAATQAPYTPPTHGASAFNCPRCGAYAAQAWAQAATFQHGSYRQLGGPTEFVICTHCRQFCFWVDGRLVYPSASPAPKPNPDLPADIQEDYNEAREIVSRSPRGAAALLRLCIQKLGKHLGEKGKNINADIASLVSKGLPPKVQQALDTVRVVGNNAVHPGQIDLKDDIDTASALFGLVNIIAEVMISQPNHVNQLYQSVIPKTQRDAISNRDAT